MDVHLTEPGGAAPERRFERRALPQSGAGLLRELKNLRVLSLRCKLTKIPLSIADVSGQLLRLCVHNEGTRLQVYNSLKKLVNLSALELTGCALERIPSSVFSLSLLQELDLRENRLTGVEEILSLQHCRRLTRPQALAQRHLLRPRAHQQAPCAGDAGPQLEQDPQASATPLLRTKLRHLDLSHNQLTALPSEIGVLQCLQFLSVAFLTRWRVSPRSCSPVRGCRCWRWGITASPRCLRGSGIWLSWFGWS